jgi:hypothetical protein
MTGQFGIVPGHYPDNILLKGILFQLLHGATITPGGTEAPVTTFGSITALQAYPTVGLALGTTFGAYSGTILGFYQLVSGNAGGILPNDASVANNVSYSQAL